MKMVFYKLINDVKIKNKLILTYLIVSIVTVSVVGIYLTNKMTNIVINKAITEASSNANSIQERFEETIKLATRVSELIYSDDKLSDIVSKKYENYADVVDTYSNYQELRKYVKYYKEFSSITLYVDNNTMLQNSEIQIVNDSIRKEKWYKKAIEDKGKISWVYKKDDLSNLYYLSLVRAIKCNTDTGNVQCVLTINLSPSMLKNISKTNEKENIIAVDYQTVSLLKNYKISEDDIKGETVKQSSEKDKNVVIKIKYDDQKSYIVKNTFTVEKAPSNEFQIMIILPITDITNATNKVIFNSFAVMSITIILSILLIMYFSKTISSRIRVLSEEMNRVVNGDFNIKNKISGKDEIGQLYKDLTTMIDSIQTLINEVYVEKIQKEKLKADQSEMEFKMLSSQINPHFLYNTLETIRMKAFCSGQIDIADIVKKLGIILRRNLEVSGKIVSLKSELELIKSYLEIQSVRFDGMVTYDLSISKDIDIEKYKILPLLLQPIVENAFIHGIEEKKEKGNIKITIYKQQDKTIIKISDNGVGMSEEKVELINNAMSFNDSSIGKSIGMKNVNQRIKIYYGNQYGLRVESRLNIGTTITFNLPV